MSNRKLAYLIVLSTLSLLGILAMQIYWFNSSLELRQQEFKQSTKIALIQVVRNLAKARKVKLPAYITIKQEARFNFIVYTNDPIDVGVLEYNLRREFLAKEIFAPFEYAIYDVKTNEMVYGNTITKEQIQYPPAKPRKLPKYKVSNYYFALKFKNTSDYILASLTLPIVFTLLLSFVLIVFSYSLLTILRQRRLSEIQKDFINNMTHEFKTPISTIRISAEFLMNTPQIKSERRLERYAEIILEQNKRLNEQVEKVLQVAKLDTQEVKMDTQYVNLCNLIDSSAEAFELRINEFKGTITSECNIKDPLVLADPIHLVNVLNSLIDNAIKYSKKAPQINLKIHEQNEFAFITVCDSGIGINQSDIKNIFKKFYRIPTGNIHNVKGFGLGLYYVYNICKSHGWLIKVKSEIGKGTQFIIRIKRTTKS